MLASWPPTMLAEARGASWERAAALAAGRQASATRVDMRRVLGSTSRGYVQPADARIGDSPRLRSTLRRRADRGPVRIVAFAHRRPQPRGRWRAALRAVAHAR